jgi:hypothetical protein
MNEHTSPLSGVHQPKWTLKLLTHRDMTERKTSEFPVSSSHHALSLVALRITVG